MEYEVKISAHDRQREANNHEDINRAARDMDVNNCAGRQTEGETVGYHGGEITNKQTNTCVGIDRL